MGIERGARRWHVDVLVAVEVPVMLRHGERVVRMGERGDHEERPWIPRPRDVEDRPLRHEGGFVVEVELVRSHT